MAHRLWLDDRRRPPWGYDLWAKTADQAIELLLAHDVEHASLDHDLAEEHYEDADDPRPGYGEPPRSIDRTRYVHKTGYAVIEWMHTANHWVADLVVHTLNGRAADEMMEKVRRCAPAWVSCARIAFRARPLPPRSR